MRRFWWWLKSLFRRQGPTEVIESPPETPPSEPEHIPPHESVPHPLFQINNLHEMGEWDRVRLVRASEILNYILRHPSTRERWLSYRAVENQGLTQAQIWDLWVRGDQLAEEDALGVTDIQVVMYHNRFSRVVGYTYLESLFVWINRRFFSSDVGRASNLGHETLGHQYGFTHTVRDVMRTVPWLVNQLIEEQYEALQLEKEFPPL